MPSFYDGCIKLISVLYTINPKSKMVWGFFLYKLILFLFVFSFSLTNFLLFLSFFFIVGQNRQQQFFANIFLIGIHRIQPEIKKWKKLEFEKLSLSRLKLCIILFVIKRLNFTILAQDFL